MTDDPAPPLADALAVSGDGAAVAWALGQVRYGWRVRADDAPLRVGVANEARSTGQGDLRVTRSTRFEGGRFQDALHAVNEGGARRSLSVDLEVDVDAAQVSAHALAFDLGDATLVIDLDPLAAAHPNGAEWALSLAPGERVTIGATIALRPPDRAG